jgi:hypothetical protein
LAFWAKDLNAAPENFNPPERSIPILIDVDQYMDMPRFLANTFKPTLIYTFQPHQVSRVATNYSFTFNENDEVEYQVTGGGQFRHRVWNYSVDNIIVTSTWFGIPCIRACFLVDRRATSDDHELILVTPLRRWVGIFNSLAGLFLSGRKLERLHIHSSGFLRLVVSKTQGLYVSTGKVGSHVQATILKAIDDAISTVSRLSKHDLTLPQVQSFIEGDRLAAAPLLDFHRAQTASKPDVVCPVSESLRRYQFDPANYDPDLKPAMVPFMSPLLDECYVFDQGHSSEVRAVEGRINSIKNPPMELSRFMLQVIDEFVRLFIPVPGQLFPTDMDELFARQDRPSQRRILEEAQFLLPKRETKTFLKKESYGAVKDPRVISQINGCDKAEYSLYIYSLADYLKTFKWYAFGCTPAEVAERVARVCESADVNAANTDFSRYDGHISNIIRHLERCILLRAFAPEHHERLAELHSRQYNLRGCTTTGVKYDTDFTRASGSPETSAFNSIDNKFVAFLNFRMTKVNGMFLTPEEAWVKPGLYGGDDGLTADVQPQVYVKAAASVGLVIEVDPIPKGEEGVMFLARVYSPDVWFGDTNSCCDVMRQLSKVHTTVCLPSSIRPIDKLAEKARAYLLTDENTPIFGEFFKRFSELYDLDTLSACPRLIWGADVPKDVQYPNFRAEWMDDYVYKCLNGANFPAFRAWLAKCATPEEMLSPPLLLEPKPATTSVPVVVDGQLLPTDTKLPPVTGPTEDEKFAKWKAKKIADGTWKEKPFDQESWKARKQEKGEWKASEQRKTPPRKLSKGEKGKEPAHKAPRKPSK